jgi:hypothetical protein
MLFCQSCGRRMFSHSIRSFLYKYPWNTSKLAKDGMLIVITGSPMGHEASFVIAASKGKKWRLSALWCGRQQFAENMSLWMGKRYTSALDSELGCG